MAHTLKLHIPDSNLDARFLMVRDFSDYDSRIAILNPAMFIQLPGFDSAIPVPFTVGGSIGYSSRTLGLTTGIGIDGLGDLPDGVYTLTYSVAPNDKVYTVYYHFKTDLIEQQMYSGIVALRTAVDPHKVDHSGNVVLTKMEQVYIRCLLLLKGIKASMISSQDLSSAQMQYDEITDILTDANFRF